MNKIKNAFKSFHNDENGDVLQTILIVLVAVLVLIAILKVVTPDLFDKVKSKITELFGMDPAG